MAPLAELHCHLEGTASPALVRRLANRNGVDLPEDMFDTEGGFAWDDFSHFLEVYNLASSVIRGPEDYSEVTCAYLAQAAAEGAIYVELMASPDHAMGNGMSYAAQIEGIAAGIDAARRRHGIEARVIVVAIRHFGPERALEVARAVAQHRHSMVTGFGLAGDERHGHPRDFVPAFRLACDAGLEATAHAGELAGPESIHAALAHLPISRLGHGVRAAEDPDLVAEIADRGIVLELCPTSNVATGVYPSFAEHPLPGLRAAGCRVTLNTDDPPYFGTTIGNEYRKAATAFKLSQRDLLEITRTAVQAAFVDDLTRARLLDRIEAAACAPE
jgi:adenosine deaminase